MWSPCFLQVTLIILLYSSYVAFAYERVLVEDNCPAEPACMRLSDRQGEIHLTFSDYTRIFHCALIFVVPQKLQVFLHIISVRSGCIGYKLRLFDGHVLRPSKELTPPRDNFCRKVDKNQTRTSMSFPRSYITASNYFTVQLENLCRKKFQTLDLNIYYQYFSKEKLLLKDFCDQCCNTTFPFHSGICESLAPNCSGLLPIRRIDSSQPDENVKKKGASSSEIFGILLAGAIVLTILVVALHCGGLPSSNGSRGRGLSDGTAPGGHGFSTGHAYGGNKGPVVHV